MRTFTGSDLMRTQTDLAVEEPRNKMQWTEPLNALLNQCVFESGYDFASACVLLKSRALKLRLVSSDVTITPTLCQDQWMAINPMMEDEQQGEGEYRACLFETTAAPLSTGYSCVADPDALTPSDDARHNDIGPRLELCLSDAELDLLLNSLPEQSIDPADDENNEGFSVRSAAKSVSREPASEMQWVLSFLSDPESIAHDDAEAKSMLANADKYEDDNYQLFLKELDQVKLLDVSLARSDMTPDAKTAAVDTAPTSTVHPIYQLADTKMKDFVISTQIQTCEPVAAPNSIAGKRLEIDPAVYAGGIESCEAQVESSESEDDEDEDDWEAIRKEIKLMLMQKCDDSNMNDVME